VTGGKLIAVLLQSISGVSAINPYSRLLRHPWRKKRGAILLSTVIGTIANQSINLYCQSPFIHPFYITITIHFYVIVYINFINNLSIVRK
jgi:hypothetical protein